MPIHTAPEEIYFLNEVEQPRHVHEAKKCGGNRDDARGCVARDKLADAQPQNEQNEKARLKVVNPRGRGGNPKPA